jgi:hypothetical protein
VQANVMDQGGGIGKIVWKINGTTVATESAIGRPESRLAKPNQQSLKNDVVTLKQAFSLLPGDNTIELFAYNQSNEIASTAATLTLTVIPPSPEPQVAAQAPAEQPPRPATPKIPAPAPPSNLAVVPPGTPPPPEQDVLLTSVKPPPTSIAASPDVSPPSSSDMAEAKQPGSPDSLIATQATDAPVARAVPSPVVGDADFRKPTLHLLVVGIDRYRDKTLQLKYAVQDGRAIADIIHQTGASLFRDVNVKLLFDDQVTIDGLGHAFREIKATIAPQDVFMFYLAGHGVTLNGRYYFLPYDFRYYNEEAIRKNAVNQDHLQKWLSLIPARKSLVLIDTCESGSFTQSMVAMRGMAQKTAIAKLTRATGRATIVASTDEQPAYEGYQGHGVFTYVLLEGLRHADATFGNRDGYTGLFELAAYVNDQVPSITMDAFNFEQIPQVHMVGSDFPIGVVRIDES